MTTRTQSHVVLICDGCRQETQQFENVTTARAVSYTNGWRFPSKVKGQTGEVAKRSSDVCPNCLDGWQPETSTWSDHNYASRGLKPR
jgi:hypothetical protein